MRVALIFIFCFLIFLFITKDYGLGVSPDSVGYISIAENISKGIGAFQVPVNWDTTTPYEPISIWPPLYPFMLAIGKMMGFSILLVARYIQAILFAFNILLGVFIIYNITKNIYSFIIGLVLLISNYSLWYIHLYAWNEDLFIFLTNTAIIFLSKFLFEKKSYYLFLCGIFVALASLTRNMGLAVCLFCIITIYISYEQNFIQKVKKSVQFFFISCFPIFLWFIRNIALTDSPISSRDRFYYLPLFTNAKRFINGISLLFIDSSFNIYVRAFIVFIVFCGISILIFKNLAKRESISKDISFIFALFIVIYVVTLFLVTTFVSFEPVGIRYLSPIVIPLIVLFFIKAISLKDRLKNFKIIFLIGFVFFVLLIYPLKDTSRLVFTAKNSGIDLNSFEWRNSEIISWLKNHKIKGRIYTNHPAAIVFLTGNDARWTVSKYNDIEGFKNKFNNKSDIIVWFDQYFYYDLLPISSLLELVDIDTQYNFADGNIYLKK